MKKKIEIEHQKFGSAIRIIREQKELTQDKVAQRMQMSRASVCNVELGRQRVLLSDVRRWAKALRVSELNLLSAVFSKVQELVHRC